MIGLPFAPPRPLCAPRLRLRASRQRPHAAAAGPDRGAGGHWSDPGLADYGFCWQRSTNPGRSGNGRFAPDHLRSARSTPGQVPVNKAFRLSHWTDLTDSLWLAEGLGKHTDLGFAVPITGGGNGGEVGVGDHTSIWIDTQLVEYELLSSGAITDGLAVPLSIHEPL